MQLNFFTGRLAGSPELRGAGDKQVCRITLIDNEYAGKDGNGQPTYRKVSVQFAIFGHDARRIHENCRKGDQLIVRWKLRNNNYEHQGETVYSYDYIADEIEFGAPGPDKRAEMSQRQAAS